MRTRPELHARGVAAAAGIAGLLTLVTLLTLACRDRRDGAAAVASSSVAAPAALASPDAAERPKTPLGLTVESAGTVTLLRVDLAAYTLRLLNAKTEGRPRRAPEWARDFGLVAVVNASMYEPSGQSVGLMINGASVNQAHELTKMGGYFAFSPRRADLPPVAAVGRDCPGADVAKLRADYAVVFQNYRLLDCDGRPLAWKEPRVFSAASIGVDKDGRVVFAHSRAPYAMTEFAKLVAAPELRIAQMFYVEGGPEASLYVHAGGVDVRAIGDYEKTFLRRDDNLEFWELPNVLGVVAK